jgi:DNA helicase-2/ATP-dependent DNA helicase PcrA
MAGDDTGCPVDRGNATYPLPMDPLLDDLNPTQRDAVLAGPGPLMVLAGAGSGKTRVITRRIARLLRDGESPGSILALTFTNKAAGEMLSRVRDLGGGRVLVATFHSSCARFLRQDGHLLGYPRDFSIYDTYDRDMCVKQLMAERGLGGLGIKPAQVGRAISRLKNQGVAPADFVQGPSDTDAIVGEIWAPYQERLLRQGAMDFDDLLDRFLALLREHPETAEQYRERFRWILVDEFQDTNRVQYDLLRALAGEYHNLCVVGDPDQSIYRFRGADIRNILDFENDFPQTRIVKLETNYRSTKCILRAAEAVIENNVQRKERALRTDNDEGAPLASLRCDTPSDEASQVVRRIVRLIEQGTSPREIAVFYRAHHLSRAFEEALRQIGVPYVVVGGLAFYERREIKDLLAYLRAVLNPLDDLSVERIVNVPTRGIGAKTLDKLRALAAEAQLSLCEAIARADLHEGLSARARASLAALAAVLDGARARAEHAAVALKWILQETDYVAQTCDLGDPQDLARQENIDELLNDAAVFDGDYGTGLAGYLAHVSLLTSEDEADEGPAVSLMSVHAAKGLEFDHVFLAGLEEGIFPHSRSVGADDQEEERRLMYVALTRARRTIVLSTCARRAFQGLMAPQEPSRFLAEIPDDCLETRPLRERGGWHDWVADDDHGAVGEGGLDGEALEPGTEVVHPTYGHGHVVRLSGRGIQTRVVVRFESGDERTLLLEYGHLQLARRGGAW